MSANSTFLVTKDPPGYSSKLDKLRELFDGFAEEHDRKILLFSEWTTMLDLIEPILTDCNLGYIRLDGSVPQKKRQLLVDEFRRRNGCNVFLATNAGAAGLNLQVANTVVNVDLPWNPAVLEQRIGRAHRMGQKRPVLVFILITEGTLEENLLSTLAAKSELSLAALDYTSDVEEVSLESGIEELKRRLELLLGAKPEAPLDESQKRRAEAEAKRRLEQRDRVSRAGGELLTAAFRFLGEIIPQSTEQELPEEFERQFRSQLESCLERDDQGRMKLTVTLPDPEAFNSISRSLARLAASGSP
jgi:superfamily II DNA/RNA helicase